MTKVRPYDLNLSDSECSDDIVITALGLNSSIGNDVVTSCASARAGIVRVSELEHMVFDFESGEMQSLSGHQVDLYTKGFIGLGRLLRLAKPALQNLLSDSGLSGELIGQTPLYLNMAHQFLFDCSSQSFDEKGVLPDLVEKDEFSLMFRQDCCEQFIPLLERDVGVKFAPEHEILFGGHEGGMSLIRKAVETLRKGEIERCIIGGIDSYVDPDSLQYLDELGLLSSPQNGAGFLPGEAAAFILLERIDSAIHRGSEVLSVVGPMGFAEEQSHRYSETMTAGIALADATKQVLEAINAKNRSIHLVVSDMNGDVWRGHEWGHALVRLQEEFHLGDIEIVFPAMSFGELGAANVIVAVCVVVRSYIYQYAEMGSILITASSYDGKKAAMVLFDVE